MQLIHVFLSTILALLQSTMSGTIARLRARASSCAFKSSGVEVRTSKSTIELTSWTKWVNGCPQALSTFSMTAMVINQPWLSILWATSPSGTRPFSLTNWARSVLERLEPFLGLMAGPRPTRHTKSELSTRRATSRVLSIRSNASKKRHSSLPNSISRYRLKRISLWYKKFNSRFSRKVTSRGKLITTCSKSNWLWSNWKNTGSKRRRNLESNYTTIDNLELKRWIVTEIVSSVQSHFKSMAIKRCKIL